MTSAFSRVPAKSRAAPSVGFVSLGCPKALVDSEQILTRLRSEGYAIAADYQAADLVVVNTCGFIDNAVEESLSAIGEALAENGKVIVTGCLGAKDGGSFVRSAHPKVLAVTGPHATPEVMAAVHTHLPKPHDPFVDLVPPQGIKLTPRHYAYLKISEGCNHRCTYTSAYGVDVRYRSGFWRGRPLKTRMTELVRALGALAEEYQAWVRLHYVYPYPHVDEIVELMSRDGAPGVLSYLDVPFQHASPRILKLMKRPANVERNLDRIRSWRAISPDLTIRSTFIVGFPGETETEFQELLAFIEESELDRVGCFAYSPVDGAAANALPDPVGEPVREDRRARFMAAQEKISRRRLARKVGRTLTVLIDQVDGSRASARSAADAPEIDGLVMVENGKNLKVGQFASVRIVASSEHDLTGRLENQVPSASRVPEKIG
ncbi:MAG: radical SAM protein [Betaproteobacteria bacterium]|nr:MAG: radical SAM protein [Betaproteobacteria bacterium]